MWRLFGLLFFMGGCSKSLFGSPPGDSPGDARGSCNAVGPNSEECDDSIDNDCDGLIDEGCDCGFAAATWGGTSNESANAIASGPDRSLLVAGSFVATADFDPGPGMDLRTATNDASGQPDAFLSKLAPDGSYLWAQTWGGMYYEHPRDVGVGADGSVFVTGFFWLTTDLDPGSGSDTRTSSGMWDVFLSKFASDGSYQWGTSWGKAEAQSQSYALGVSPDGHVVVVGQYGASNSGGAETFVLKLGSDGTTAWEKRWETNALPQGVAVTDDGSIYLAGQFEGAADFDPGVATDLRTTHGARDAFLSRFEPSGTWTWTVTWGGAEDDYAVDVAVGSGGQVSVAGAFNGSADFDPGPGSATRTSAGSWDAFVTTFGPDGTYQWARTWGDTGSNMAVALGSAPDGSLRVTGYAVSGPALVVYVARLEADGAEVWTKLLSGTSSGSPAPSDVAVDVAGATALTGTFVGTVDLDPGSGSDTHTSTGGLADVFVASLCPEPAD